MDPQLDLAFGRVLSRRSLRRAVQLEADVMSELWDGAVPLPLSNLSQHGAWLDSELALHVGDELSLTFTPPRWQNLGLPKLRAHATVARVSLRRRRGDAASAGMGLCFTGLSPVTACCLDSVLRGLPPPLPAAQPSAGTLSRDAEDPARLCLDDGSCFVWLAEAPLLSAQRVAPSSCVSTPPRAAAPRRAVASESASIASLLLAASARLCANQAATPSVVGSPMTAIFRRPRSTATRVAS
jgi:hypothetical protein